MSTCEQTGLLTTHSHARFIFYKLMTAIPVTAAVVVMVRHADSILWLLGYIGLCLTHALIMFLSKCPHCAYYKTDSRIHRCFFIWGVPKIRAANDGPAPGFLKVYVPLAILTLAAYPVYWLRFQWELGLIYGLSLVTLLFSILQQECSRCVSFDCPNCSVPDEVRQRYLATLNTEPSRR